MTLSFIYTFHLLLYKPPRRINSPLFMGLINGLFLLACQHFLSFLSMKFITVRHHFIQIYIQSGKCEDCR